MISGFKAVPEFTAASRREKRAHGGLGRCGCGLQMGHIIPTHADSRTQRCDTALTPKGLGHRLAEVWCVRSQQLGHLRSHPQLSDRQTEGLARGRLWVLFQADCILEARPLLFRFPTVFWAASPCVHSLSAPSRYTGACALHLDPGCYRQ